MNSGIFLLAIVSLIQFVAGQPGQSCMTSALTPIHFFDLQKFTGKWYMQQFRAGVEGDKPYTNFKCYSITYDTVDGAFDEQLSAVEELTVIQEDAQEVQLVNDVHYTNLNTFVDSAWKVYFNRTRDEAEMAILHTDYDNWMVQYGCYKGLDLYRNQHFTIWTREREFNDPQLLSFLNTIALDYGFPAENILTIDQSNCDA